MKYFAIALLALFWVLPACVSETPGDDDDTTASDDDVTGDDDSSSDDDDTSGDDDSATGDDDSSGDDDTSGDDDSATGDDDSATGDDDSAIGDDDDSAASDLVWWFTCGDPVCHGYSPSGNPVCSSQTVGTPCSPSGDTCDLANDGCNVRLLCTLTDPAQNCPISRRRYKTDIDYLDAAEIEGLRNQLIDLRLARYRYTIPGSDVSPRLGFIIDDHPGLPAVQGDRVDLYAYTSMLVGALQAQEVQLKIQQAQIEALQAEVKGIKDISP